MLYIHAITILCGSFLGLVSGRLLQTTAVPFFYGLLGTCARMILFTSSLYFLLRWAPINPILFVVSYILCFWMRAFARFFIIVRRTS